MTQTPEAPAASNEAATTDQPQEIASASSAQHAAPPRATEHSAQPSEAADDGDESDSDEQNEAAGPEGPEGPEGPSAGGEKKKKKRRRKKTPGEATAAGPEGPPVEATREGSGPRDGGKGRPALAQRERATSFTIGEEVFGRVTAVLEHAIMVDLAGKALAIFDRSELAADDLVPAVGDRFVAQVLGDGGRGGLVVISRRLLREEETKPLVEKAFQEKTTVPALITGTIKGGIEAYADGLRAFVPASHVDLHPGSDLTHLIGQRLDFHVEQYAKRGRDVVLSRRAMLDEEHKKQRENALAKLAEGQVVKGVVRTVMQWGVFVAIPEADNIEGLVHASEMSHDPRARLHELVKVGDEIDVKIAKIDERGKLWLSKKATEADPWAELRAKYAPGTRHTGKVTRIQPFGAFVELEPGLDGLIAIADLSIKRIEKPEDAVTVGQDIEVVVDRIDAGTKKIGLHPAPPAGEARQKLVPNKAIKVVVVAADVKGLTVRVLGASGRNARGFIPASHTGTPRGADLRKAFPQNSEHEAKVLEADPRRGEIKLSIRGMREDNEKNAYNEYRATVAKEAKFGTFADLLKKAQQGSL